MFKKFLSISIFALSLLCLQSKAAFAHHCGCGEMSHKMHEAMEKINLSDEQKGKIKEAMDKAHDALKAKHDEMRDVRMLINGAFKDGTMNEAKIDEFSNKQMHIMGAIMKIRMMERFAISQVLTDEQKEMLNDMLHQWMEQMNADEGHSCHKAGPEGENHSRRMNTPATNSNRTSNS